MRVAQIQNDIVVALHEADSINSVYSMLTIQKKTDKAIEAPSWVKIGTIFNGVEFIDFTPKSEPMLELSASITTQEVVQWAEAKLQATLADIPVTERTSWDMQVKEAREILAGTNIPTPFIDSQIKIIQPSETRQELAQKILQKAERLAAFTGLVVGIRRSFIRQIEMGLTQPVFVGSLDEALQQALEG